MEGRVNVGTVWGIPIGLHFSYVRTRAELGV